LHRGEIENKLSKNQRNETRQYKQRIQIGCYQDGIYTINVNATIFEIGFLEVVGSAIYVDITKLNKDTEKVFKCRCLYFTNANITYNVERKNNNSLPWNLTESLYIVSDTDLISYIKASYC